MAETLVWEVIRPHAPDEYEERPANDPDCDWQFSPEVKEEIRPAIALEAETAAFLLEQGLKLTPDADALFVDAVGDNLLPAFQRLQALARGDFSPDKHPSVFPALEEVSAVTPVKALELFDAWRKAVQPAEGTVLRLFRCACRRNHTIASRRHTAARWFLVRKIDAVGRQDEDAQGAHDPPS
ncbi:hypothetical protein [Bradyrhizobium canariense]|uniref:hypothetical protein n=1 Tax=Bradyrhizobium canariense TaxID=255045 RepID=UPI001FCD0703|nr:hypothetical protein [Bradyrhizobium canariense]